MLWHTNVSEDLVTFIFRVKSFEVFTAMRIQVVVFWVPTPSSVVAGTTPLYSLLYIPSPIFLTTSKPLSIHPEDEGSITMQRHSSENHVLWS
jgi:hypothetical protein